MSTKRFCDVCERAITESMTKARVKESTVLRYGHTQETVNIEITCGVGHGSWNGGDLCKSCLYDALDRFDPRPKEGPA